MWCIPCKYWPTGAQRGSAAHALLLIYMSLIIAFQMTHLILLQQPLLQVIMVQDCIYIKWGLCLLVFTEWNIKTTVAWYKLEPRGPWYAGPALTLWRSKVHIFHSLDIKHLRKSTINTALWTFYHCYCPCMFSVFQLVKGEVLSGMDEKINSLGVQTGAAEKRWAGTRSYQTKEAIEDYAAHSFSLP